MQRFHALLLFVPVIPWVVMAQATQPAETPPGFLEQLMGNPMVVLFVVIASGMLLGQLSLAGLSLGSSGVIFTALAAGHLGYHLPGGIGTLGMLLFVYSIGLTAGPGFFRVFRQQGKTLAILAVVLVTAGAATTWVLARTLHLPTDLAAGLFAGALTSTPGLAAVMEALPSGSQAAVGYGIAYPFGVIGVVLFVQLLPRLLRIDLDEMDRQLHSSTGPDRTIHRVLVEVQNPALSGRRLADLEMIAEANCQITRVLHDDRLMPIDKDFLVEPGQHLLLVGRAFRLDAIIALLGRKSTRTDYHLDTEHERMQVVVTSKNIVGKSIGALRLLGTFGVTVSRITRHEVEFVPDLEDIVQWGDALLIVGAPGDLARFAQYAGHRTKAFDQTDLISLGLGIIAGVVLGSITLGFGSQRFALGMVGGPMLVALLVGHFGRIGRIYGSLPRASRLLMMELGLVFFLADAGVKAGGSLFEVIQTYGLSLCGAALAATIVPMAVGVVVARGVFKMNFLQVLGGTCGGMTSTPGLGVLTARTDSDIPIVSYAAAYPVALILMTILGHALVALLP